MLLGAYLNGNKKLWRYIKSKKQNFTLCAFFLHLLRPEKSVRVSSFIPSTPSPTLGNEHSLSTDFAESSIASLDVFD